MFLLIGIIDILVVTALITIIGIVICSVLEE